jgi:curved DNA-binding protein CbpA
MRTLAQPFHSSMRLKDHYKALGVQPAADAEEIKKSYRRLVLKYHPDKAPDNPFAESHFITIREAYAVLSDPARRKAYDEERWLSGMSSRARDQVKVTPEWILEESRRLRRHMETVDTYRMNQQALKEYVLLLLSDDHLAILHQERNEKLKSKIAEMLLEATRKLRTEYMQPVMGRLAEVGEGDEAFIALLEQDWQQRQREARWNKALPLIIILAALAVCGLILALA